MTEEQWRGDIRAKIRNKEFGSEALLELLKDKRCDQDLASFILESTDGDLGVGEAMYKRGFEYKPVQRAL